MKGLSRLNTKKQTTDGQTDTKGLGATQLVELPPGARRAHTEHHVSHGGVRVLNPRAWAWKEEDLHVCSKFQVSWAAQDPVSEEKEGSASQVLATKPVFETLSYKK